MFNFPTNTHKKAKEKMILSGVKRKKVQENSRVKNQKQEFYQQFEDFIEKRDDDKGVDIDNWDSDDEGINTSQEKTNQLKTSVSRQKVFPQSNKKIHEKCHSKRKSSVLDSPSGSSSFSGRVGKAPCKKVLFDFQDFQFKKSAGSSQKKQTSNQMIRASFFSLDHIKDNLAVGEAEEEASYIDENESDISPIIEPISFSTFLKTAYESERSKADCDDEEIINESPEASDQGQNLPFERHEEERSSFVTEKETVSSWASTLQVNLKTPEKEPVELNTTEVFKATSGKKNKQKFLKDGLAERALKLAARHRSALRFWMHHLASAATTGENRKLLKVIIKKVWYTFGSAVCECTALLEKQDVAADVHVVFSEEHTLKVKVGEEYHIHPPWQKLTLWNGKQVILCTDKARIVSAKSEDQQPPASTSSAVCDTYHFIWACPCFKDASVQQQKCPAIIRPTDTTKPVVFEDWIEPNVLDKTHHAGDLETVDEVCAGVQDKQEECVQVDGIQQAVEKKTDFSKDGIEFSACVHRLCKKTSFVTRTKDATACSYSIILSDKLGVFCELLLSSSENGEFLTWDQLLHKGEGHWWRLGGLKTIQRANRAKHKALFSVIDAIQGQNFVAKPTPAVCYILRAMISESVCCALDDPVDLHQHAMPVLTELKTLMTLDTSQRVTCQLKVLTVWTDDNTKVLVATDKTNVVQSVMCDKQAFLEDAVRTGFCATFRDLYFQNDRLLFDGYTQYFQADHLYEFGSNVSIPPLSSRSSLFDVVTLTGSISCIDEEQAYSWQVCSWCGSDQLEGGSASNPFVRCTCCNKSVGEPVTLIHLQVYLNVPTITSGLVQVQLQHDTAVKLLPASLNDSQEGCDMNTVLGTKLSNLNCIIIKDWESVQTLVYNGPAICVHELKL